MQGVQAAAVAAAKKAAARYGVKSAEPAVLADGANVVVHLRPAPVVAKVAASTPAVRPDVARWLQRELDLAVFLGDEGIPVMAPSGEVPVTVHQGDGQVMSFWTFVEPSDAGRPGEAVIGSMLRDLHTALSRYRGPLPALAPLADIPAFLDRPRTRLSAADRASLASAYARLTADLAEYSPQPLHGDAGAGNLMAVNGGWIWHDFEDTCTGPVAWDLAATTASAYLDGSRILAAYGEVPALLRTCEQLRRLHLTVWYSLYAERLPQCRQRADELLRIWRLAAIRAGTRSGRWWSRRPAAAARRGRRSAAAAR